MSNHNDQVREALAAEYALGTLQGAARRRFERSLKGDPGLRRLVGEWQSRLAPLDEAAPPIAPPARVWAAIQQRIAPSGRRAGLWNSLGFWRGSAVVSTAAALILAAVLLVPGKPRETMVVVMSDDRSRPAITVSWPMHQAGEKRLRVRVMGHQSMAPDTAWELWMLPPGEQKPVSLGLITTHETQHLVLSPALSDTIDQARALAMSVEPKGGSPTGLPTGPVLYKGPCAEM